MFSFFNVGYLLNRDLVTLLHFNKNPTADLCAWAAARLCLLRHIWPSLSASRWPRITFTWPCRAIATSQWQSPHSTTWVRIQPRPQRSWPWELTALTLLSHHSISSMCCLDKTARLVSKRNQIVFPTHSRLNSTEYAELREKLRAPIRNSPNVVIHQTLSELFLETFKAQVDLNQPYALPHGQVHTAAFIKLCPVLRWDESEACAVCVRRS